MYMYMYMNVRTMYVSGAIGGTGAIDATAWVLLMYNVHVSTYMYMYTVHLYLHTCTCTCARTCIHVGTSIGVYYNMNNKTAFSEPIIALCMYMYTSYTVCTCTCTCNRCWT